MICIVGCQEEGVFGEGVDAVTQDASPDLHPKAGPGNKTLNLPQIPDSSRAKVTSEQGQRETPWPQLFLFTWVFYTFNVYSPVGIPAFYRLLSFHRKKNQPQVICMMNSPSALISAACLQLDWCALNLENIFNFQNSFDVGREEGTAKNNTLQIKFGITQDFFYLRKKILQDTNKYILLS